MSDPILDHNHRGDGAPAQPDPSPPSLLDGTRPRPVTVDTARRLELWRYGTLIRELPDRTLFVVGMYDGTLFTDAGEEIDGVPSAHLTFVPA